MQLSLVKFSFYPYAIYNQKAKIGKITGGEVVAEKYDGIYNTGTIGDIISENRGDIDIEGTSHSAIYNQSGTMGDVHGTVFDDKVLPAEVGDPTPSFGDDPVLISYELSRENGEDAGIYDIMPEGEESQGNYKVRCVNGTLTINPKAVVVTIIGHNGSFSYDGSSHSVYGYDVQIGDDR